MDRRITPQFSTIVLLLLALITTGCLQHSEDWCGEPAADTQSSDVPAVTETIGPEADVIIGPEDGVIIGPEGGILVGPGEATLVVPTDALPEATHLTVTLATEDEVQGTFWTPLESVADTETKTVSADVDHLAYFRIGAPSGVSDEFIGIGPILAFQPLGQQFETLVTIILPYNPTDIPDGGDEVDLVVLEAKDTWTDPTSALTWQVKLTGGNMIWEAAKSHCSQLALDGSDWRLPTIDELRTLIRGCPATELGGSCHIEEGERLFYLCRDDSCSGCSQGDGPADGCYMPNGMQGNSPPFIPHFWSSSLAEPDEDFAWVVGFGNGIVAPAQVGNPIHSWVRCVR